MVLLYNHNDINNKNDNTNTSGTNEFISFYLQSLVTREGRHKSLNPMLTIECSPPTRGASCGV